MSTASRVRTARADVVGSLLRPAYLREARAGDFSPLRHVRPGTEVVLGLLTTKKGDLEDATQVEARIREAARYVDLSRLALSSQCGFASGEAGNPLTPNQQEAKLRLVVQVARKVWTA